MDTPTMNSDPKNNGMRIIIISVVVVILGIGAFIIFGGATSDSLMVPENETDVTGTETGITAGTGESNTGTITAPSAQTVTNTLGKAVMPDPNLAFQVYAGSYGLDKVLLLYKGNTALDARLSDGRSVGMLDKQKVTRETLILSFAQGDATPASFIFSGDGKRIALTLTRMVSGSLLAELYRVDLSTIGKTAATRLISYAVSPASTRYGVWKGVPQVTRFVEDRYVILSIPICRDCDTGVARGVSVVSVSTGKEIFLGEVGDLTFNLSTDTVSYRVMGPVTVPCSSDDYTGLTPTCASGETTKVVYQASGSPKTAKLP